MKIQWKISNALNLLLLIFSAECIASTVNFDDPETITNGYTIQDYEIYKRTQLQIDFSGTLAVSLNMNYALFSDEYFAFKLNNFSGITVNRLFFEFAKPEGETFVNTPLFAQWSLSVKDIIGQITVDKDNIQISETDSSVGVDIPFLEDREWNADDAVYFFLRWDGFHNSRVNWTLNIDLNERVQFDHIVSAPIPSAIWLFGSGLVGIIVFPHRKKKGIGKQDTP